MSTHKEQVVKMLMDKGVSKVEAETAYDVIARKKRRQANALKPTDMTADDIDTINNINNRAAYDEGNVSDLNVLNNIMRRY